MLKVVLLVSRENQLSPVPSGRKSDRKSNTLKLHCSEDIEISWGEYPTPKIGHIRKDFPWLRLSCQQLLEQLQANATAKPTMSQNCAQWNEATVSTTIFMAEAQALLLREAHWGLQWLLLKALQIPAPLSWQRRAITVVEVAPFAIPFVVLLGSGNFFSLEFCFVFFFICLGLGPTPAVFRGYS